MTWTLPEVAGSTQCRNEIDLHLDKGICPGKSSLLEVLIKETSILLEVASLSRQRLTQTSRDTTIMTTTGVETALKQIYHYNMTIEGYNPTRYQDSRNSTIPRLVRCPYLSQDTNASLALKHKLTPLLIASSKEKHL